MQAPYPAAPVNGFAGLTIGLILLFAYVAIRLSTEGIERYTRCKMFFLVGILISVLVGIIEGLLNFFDANIYGLYPLDDFIISTLFCFFFLIPVSIDILLQWYRLRSTNPISFDE
jgi:hypothetical protein